ncbi:hypothetical protein K458DRAFT_486088 [Lentithecium fluviatile CBS 122367]|uniref:Uncharacterized protein n=1 Tax=Lentithecium fluviatile CBS 122367 TaxID=1168545 RepID=A0A6G1J6Z6_9PLEO|nr:hypothetical protein K458DRAFT_486088 [Lentithecium fluviatile CBS 122367]
MQIQIRIPGGAMGIDLPAVCVEDFAKRWTSGGCGFLLLFLFCVSGQLRLRAAGRPAATSGYLAHTRLFPFARRAASKCFPPVSCANSAARSRSPPSLHRYSALQARPRRCTREGHGWARQQQRQPATASDSGERTRPSAIRCLRSVSTRESSLANYMHVHVARHVHGARQVFILRAWGWCLTRRKKDGGLTRACIHADSSAVCVATVKLQEYHRTYMHPLPRRDTATAVGLFLFGNSSMVRSFPCRLNR